MKELYRILALDFGTKRIGVAISDELRMLASPRGVLANSPKVPREILDLAVNENVRMILVGLPSTLSGGDSDMTRQVRKFVETLRKALTNTNIQLEMRDERLTSIIANYNISQRGLPKRKREEKSLRDEEAARIVLQEYLDHFA